MANITLFSREAPGLKLGPSGDIEFANGYADAVAAKPTSKTDK